MDESSLLRRAAAGDGPAFEALVSRHAAAILAVARARTSDDALAEEIVQDTFVRLFRSLARFRGDSSLRTWLVRVALNLITDAHRRDPRRFEVGMDGSRDFRSEREDAERAGIRSQQAERVRQAIARLSEPLRLAVTLRYDAGLAYAEIGRVLDVPIGTVASRLTAALRQLRADLATDDTSHGGDTDGTGHGRNTHVTGHGRNTAETQTGRATAETPEFSRAAAHPVV